MGVRVASKLEISLGVSICQSRSTFTIWERASTPTQQATSCKAADSYFASSQLFFNAIVVGSQKQQLRPPAAVCCQTH